MAVPGNSLLNGLWFRCGYAWLVYCWWVLFSILLFVAFHQIPLQEAPLPEGVGGQEAFEKGV